MFNKPIEEMDFKELRNAVQVLYDAYAKSMRVIDDALQNLGMENFSGVFKKELDGMLASVEIDAEGIRTEVKNYTDEALKNYSTTEQTAQAITSHVGIFAGEIENNYSTKEQTAAAIRNEVASLTEAGGELDTRFSELEQTAGEIKASVESVKSSALLAETNSTQALQTSNMIQTVVSKQLEINNAEEALGVDDMKTPDTIYVIRKRDGDTIIGEAYYYYDGTNATPIVVDPIYTVFEQTAEGFKMKGNVSISGDLITFGTVSGNLINGGEISGVIVSTAKNPTENYVRLNSGTNSLEVLFGKDNVVAHWIALQNGISQIRPVGGGNLVVGDDTVNNGKLLAVGEWSFLEASVSGLGVVPVFG